MKSSRTTTTVLHWRASLAAGAVGCAALTSAQVPPADDFGPWVLGRVLALAVQPDRAVLLGGVFDLYPSSLWRLNQAGEMDESFGATPNGAVTSVVLLPDGGMLVAGVFTKFAGQARSGIARIHPDGRLDTGFEARVSGGDEAVGTLALQPDGKVLIGGRFTSVFLEPRYNLARLNADGSVDRGFYTGTDGRVGALALQPDGKVLIGGSFNRLIGLEEEPIARIARLNADGSIDRSFRPGANGSVTSIVVQPDGKILVGGGFTTMGGTTRKRLARLNPDGTLDAEFAPDIENHTVWSLALQSDGSLLAGGEFTHANRQPRGGLARFTSSGGLDAGFDAGVSGEGFSAAVYSLALQADGRLLVGGEFDALNGELRFSFGRLANTEPATQELRYQNSTITWSRGGTAPEVWRTGFESSGDGTAWTPLGPGHRTNEGWELPGVSVPDGAWIRARGFVTGGAGNSSGWFVESVLQVQPTAPTITSIRLNDGKAHIRWEGSAILQAAESIAGPWTEVPDAVSPVAVSPDGAGRFFRLKQ